MNTPSAPITELRLTTDSRGLLWWLVRIKCPHCGKRHTHGGGTAPEPDLGHRLPHCATTETRPGYWLTKTERTKITADHDTRHAATWRQAAAMTA